MRFYRRLLLGATFLALGATGAPAQEVELTFRYAYENVDEIRAGLDVFEEQNPGIGVTLERIAFKDARDQFIREAATGGGPDVLHLAFVWIKDLGAAEACMQLNELIEQQGIGEVGFEDFIATDLCLRRGRREHLRRAVRDRHLGHGLQHRRHGRGGHRAGAADLGRAARGEPQGQGRTRTRSASASPPARRARTPSGSWPTSTGGRMAARWWSTTARAATRSASALSRSRK